MSSKERGSHLSHKEDGSSAGGSVPRAKSVSSKPPHPQTRTHSKKKAAPPPSSTSANIHKTNSETSLSNGLRKLNINEHTNTRTRPGSGRRSASGRSSSSGSSSSGSHRCQTLQDVARYILDKKAKNIVVMAGAGISTSSGIPDFRTPGTGLYDNLKQYKIPHPEAIFDIDYFETHPKPFYTLAKEIFPNAQFRPNYAHYFLRLLHDKGLLLRLYTQNIDGLERLAGIPPEKLVEAHGNFQTVSCIRCKQKQDTEEIKNAIFSDRIPRCKRNGCLGLVKPDIVFFGEDLPRRFYYYLKDFPQADLLLVLGTSLEVEPFAGIVDSVRFYVPRVLFNRQAVGPFKRKRRMSDVAVQGDLVEQLKEFVDILGWRAEIKRLLPEKQEENEEEKSNNLDSESSNSRKSSQSKTEKDTSRHPVSERTTRSHSSKEVQNGEVSKLTKRQPLPKPPMIQRNSNLAVISRMIRANHQTHNRPMNGRPSVSHKNGGNHTNSALPRIGHRTVPFHAQRGVYRNPRLLPASDQSSSGSSDDESDSDDG